MKNFLITLGLFILAIILIKVIIIALIVIACICGPVIFVLILGFIIYKLVYAFK